MLVLLLPVSLLAWSQHGAAPATRASRLAVPRMASWAAVDGGTRSDSVSALNALKESGDAPLWNTFRLAPRAVSLGELCRTTKLEEKVLDPTATEFSLEDIQDTFIKVVVGCTVGAIGWAVISDALGLDAGLRFTGTYLFAGIPIGILAVGSTAPGLLFLPIEAFRAATADEEARRLRSERVCRHEASHLLCAYVLGLPAQEVTAQTEGPNKGPRVVVYDEELVQQPGTMVSAEQVGALAVVALSGLMAEADAYGKALGATEDLKLLNSILARCSPPIPAQKQQETTRYAALTAWTILKKHSAAYEAITDALVDGKSLSECLAAAEAAEARKSDADKAEATALAEKIASETPQERAAREREEMAARGRF